MRNRPWWAAAALWAAAAAAAAAPLQGVLDWPRRLVLSTPVSGVVAEVKVQPGQRVAKGGLLLRLDNRALRARLERARAALAPAERRYAEARRELERNQELYDQGLLAEHELETARIAHDEAKAARAAARAQEVEAAQALEYSALRAPFAAWVLRRLAEPGQTVVSRLQAVPLLELAEAGAMLARVEVDLATARALRPGAAATVEVDGRRYAGRVHSVALEPSETGRYPVAVRFPVTGLLRAGAPASVSFP